MRKVKVVVNPFINNKKQYKGEGYFHKWGILHGDFGNCTVAIVEDKEGNIWNVYPEDLKFLEPVK